MNEVGSGRIRRSVGSRFVALGALALLVGSLAACDTTPVVVSGTVSAAPSGAGVGGVTVSVFADDAETLVAEAVTNASGAYALRSSQLADGPYRVRAGDQWWPEGDSWSQADTVELSGSSVTTIDASIAEIGSLTGSVVDDGGIGLDAILVAALRASDGQVVGITNSGATGAFTIPVVTAGTHQVLFFDQSGTRPAVFVGGTTPTELDVVAGDASVGAIVMSTGLPYAAQLGTTTRVSVSSNGTQGFLISDEASISADGRYVAFNSRSTSLVADDTNGVSDVFLRDTVGGTTTRVSLASDGTEANGASQMASISPDGRYIAFESDASDLVAGDDNGVRDVFVHDTATGTTTRVSVTSDGTQGTGASSNAAISENGRYIVFESWAWDLVAGDNNSHDDVFVHDTTTGTTNRVSVATDGTQANSGSYAATVSADGRFIAFSSLASNLVDGDTNGLHDVFVHDTATGATKRVSVATDGTQGSTTTGPGYGTFSSISPDGRYIAFDSALSNLVPGDTNDHLDVFVHDTTTGTTTRVSVASDGTQGNNTSMTPSISTDGRYIAYTSLAGTLVPGEANNAYDVFMYASPAL